MFFRANATFTYLTDEVRAGLNDGDPARVKTALTQLASVGVEVTLLGIAIRCLGRIVSSLFFSFSLECMLTVCHVAGRFDRRCACLGASAAMDIYLHTKSTPTDFNKSIITLLSF